MKLILLAIIVSHVFCDTQSMLAGLKLAQNKPGIVVDVGANGGGETIMALQHNRTVFAVECLASAYNDLLEMFVNTKNVTLIHACAGEKTEMKILHLADDSSSLIHKNVASGEELQKSRRVHNMRRHNIEHVIVVPLDNLIRTPVALMKIDVQGFESQVLKGAERIISNYKPVLVYEATPEFSKRSVDLPTGYICHANGSDQVCQYPFTKPSL